MPAEQRAAAISLPELTPIGSPSLVIGSSEFLIFKFPSFPLILQLRCQAPLSSNPALWRLTAVASSHLSRRPGSNLAHTILAEPQLLRRSIKETSAVSFFRPKGELSGLPLFFFNIYFFYISFSGCGDVRGHCELAMMLRSHGHREFTWSLWFYRTQWLVQAPTAACYKILLKSVICHFTQNASQDLLCATCTDHVATSTRRPDCHPRRV